MLRNPNKNGNYFKMCITKIFFSKFIISEEWFLVNSCEMLNQVHSNVDKNGSYFINNVERTFETKVH